MSLWQSHPDSIARSWWWQAPTTEVKEIAQWFLQKGQAWQLYHVKRRPYPCLEMTDVDPMSWVSCEEQKAVGCHAASFMVCTSDKSCWVVTETARTKTVSWVAKDSSLARWAAELPGHPCRLLPAQLNCSQGLSLPSPAVNTHILGNHWNGRRVLRVIDSTHY